MIFSRQYFELDQVLRYRRGKRLEQFRFRFVLRFNLRIWEWSHICELEHFSFTPGLAQDIITQHERSRSEGKRATSSIKER